MKDKSHPIIHARCITCNSIIDIIDTSKPSLCNNCLPDNKLDMVNSPSHYTQGGMEVVKVLEAKLTSEELKGYYKGSVLKYLFRCEYKGHAKQDLEKANWYLKRLIELY